MVNNELKRSIKNFWSFVDAHRCDKENQTHTILKAGGGKYCFEGTDYQCFMKLYVDVVKSDADIDLHFVERLNDHKVSFLFIDVDYDHKGGKRLYTDEHIQQIIENTNTFLCENFNVTNYHLQSFVTEKPKPSKRNDSNYKDGFHIYYPNLPLEAKYRYYVMDYLRNLMIDNELLEGIDYKNPVDKIFDMSIISGNGILMIGSKKEGGNPYKLTHVYDANLNNLDIDEYDDEELIYALSNRRYDVDGSIEPIDDDEVIEKIDIIDKQYNGGIKKENYKR